MSVLDSIIAGVREDLEARRIPLPEVERAAAAAPAPLPVVERLRSPGLSVIAEVKRSSPSKGSLAEIADPAALAASYEAGGAAAISVLTERRRFGGSLEDLDAVRARVGIPVLRKEFMVDEYQFHEARAHGADLVLLIVAALDDAQLRDFHDLTGDLGMTALVEAHTEEEVERAINVGAQLIGINNRNLKTLEVNLDTFAPLADRIRGHACVVGESGVLETGHAQRLADEGADAILVGEALVRDGDPTDTVRRFSSLTPRT